MRMLVTGGAGFLGSDFVRHTARTRPDVEVTVLDALTYAGSRESLQVVADRVTVVHGDVTDAGLVDTLAAASDTVVHFAAETHNDASLRRPESFVTTNVLGTSVVLEAVRRHGCRLHHVSTDEVFGDLPTGTTATFDAASPYRPSSPYSATKASSDLLVRAWARSYGVAATTTNASNCYGPFQHVEKFVPRQITHLLTGLEPVLYGSGTHQREWLFVDDHTSAVWAVLDRGEVGRTYLVGTGTQHANADVLAMIQSLLGVDLPARHVADRPGHDRRYGVDASELRRLGWQPVHTDLRAGLAETIAWYRRNRAWWQTMKQSTERWYAQVQAHAQG